MKQLCGIFDLKKKEYVDRSKEICSYQHEDCEMYLYGNIRFNCDDLNEELLLKRYQEFGDGITEQIQGIYILIIYDKKRKTLRVFQDRTTSSLTLYYTTNNDKVYLGTSLKWLLKESGIERKFNEHVFEEFLVNGFIYGKQTLLQNIYKISAFASLYVQDGQVREIPSKYAVRHMTKGEAMDQWNTALLKAIDRCISGQSEINLPLSSGYDSNYIACIASEKGNMPINAYSVGGKFGKNELPIVQENVAAYRNMQLSTALTDGFTLYQFPDIVWRLEGAVYEVGIFLQYELAKMVRKSGKTNLICGECADQVMNQYYLDHDRICVARKEGTPVYYEFSEYPYIFGSYLILKKNGIMANSFGIETKYPYLDDEFVSIAHALRNINGKDKRIHIAICRELLPTTVANNISKIGGATDFHSLFGRKEDLDRFILSVENSEFYQKYASVIKSRSYIEKERQTGIKRMKTKVRNLVLDVCHVNVEERKQSAYYFEEIKLKEFMCCAYLMLFEQLFISGKYDDKMDCEGIQVDIYDLINAAEGKME